MLVFASVVAYFPFVGVALAVLVFNRLLHGRMLRRRGRSFDAPVTSASQVDRLFPEAKVDQVRSSHKLWTFAAIYPMVYFSHVAPIGKSEAGFTVPSNVRSIFGSSDKTIPAQSISSVTRCGAFMQYGYRLSVGANTVDLWSPVVGRVLDDYCALYGIQRFREAKRWWWHPAPKSLGRNG